MEFFPLALGIPKLRGRRDEAQRGAPGGDAPPLLTYDAWREGLSGSGPEGAFDVHPAEDVFLRLTQGDPALPARPWVVLGEPGAGKTSLLKHWHAAWLRALPQPRLGMRVPVLVRLRDVPREDLTGGDPAAAADALWARGLAAGLAAARGAAVFDLPPRVFTPVWLLDGLDELAAPPIADGGLWDLLRALPGEVVLTCRTAVFQSARAETTDRIGSQWCLLGLRPGQEQAEFLAQAYAMEGMDPGRAPGMVRDLNANSALRPLAAIPLLLKLVAEAGPHLVLPATRAGFYEAAANALWERRLRDRPGLLDLAPERDAALAALAAAMGLDTLEARPEALRRAGAGPELREALRRSGLLHFDDRRGRVGFPHLTFQEFHLARALLGRAFGEVLRERWGDPRHEEVLALLAALHAGEGRIGMVEAELRGFVAEARMDHARNPQRLWSLGRSPLRTALHVLARAAVSPEPALPISLADEPGLLRLAVACDRRAPASALAGLAHDPDVKVRRAVAGNTAAPAAALVGLARDPEARERVARNAAAPASALVELARDPDVRVRLLVAQNAAGSVGLVRNPNGSWGHVVARKAAASDALLTTLSELARDPDMEVRQAVARNVVVPASTLAELAHDPRMQLLVAGNVAAPATLLTALARDPDVEVRRTVARNAAAPSGVLTELGRDPRLRRVVAENAAAPASLLVELARDPKLRRMVAGNTAAPAALLVELAQDAELRRAVAGNAAAPAAALAELARDLDAGMRCAVARHAAAPAVLLAELARDPAAKVRSAAAANATAPASALVELARDPEVQVRSAVAWNVAAPAAALAELARDPEMRTYAMGTPLGIGNALAQNTAAPAVLLVELARDPATWVRSAVARNVAVPAAALAELARDPDVQVRWAVARSAAILLEDLADGT